MRRLAIFAHHDASNEVKPYVLYLLRALREICEQITFVSTAALPAHELDRLGEWCSEILLKDNVGFDFGMWKHALGRIRATDWDEVLVTNSSVFGPLWPLSPIFDNMNQQPCDFWGMTSSIQIDWHIQSYFLVFRRRVLESPAFGAFWDSVVPFANKKQVIRSYEVGLTVYLAEQGFRGGAVVPFEHVHPRQLLVRSRFKKPMNTTTRVPMRLLARKMPFVKIELLRDNPYSVPVLPVLLAMRRAGYPMDLVEFDRAPKRATAAAKAIVRLLDRVRSRTCLP